MADVEKRVETAKKTLVYVDKRTNEILERGNKREIDRQVKSIEALLEKLYLLKGEVLESKIENDEGKMKST